jgi:hypothetical protein
MTRQVNRRTPAARIRIATLSGVLLAALLIGGSPQAQAAPPAQATFYTVEEDDRWEIVAYRFGISQQELWLANGITNPLLLAPGQQLFIPGGRSPQDTDGERIKMTVSKGLLRLCVDYDSLLVSVAAINEYTWPYSAPELRFYLPNGIKHLRSPLTEQELLSPPAAPPSPLPPSPAPADLTLPPLTRSRLGIQAHLDIPPEERARLLDMVAGDLRFTWIKQQVSWKLMENAPDQYTPEMATLDSIVDDAHARGLNVLLSVSKAPDWARTTTEEDGPPANYADFDDFLTELATRYRGKVQAYEIWNESNLQREWNGAPLSGAEYVRLLAGAYLSIHAVDPHALVISGAPAPTGINDGVTAIDDRVYMRQMYEAGVASYANGIGIHPYGWGNPPSARCCASPGGPQAWNDNPTFFFLDTMEGYRAIQTEFEDDGRPLWVTEFGWASVDGFGVGAPAGEEWVGYINEQQQADYIFQAYRMAQEWNYMGPMFLWNLNLGPFLGNQYSQAYFSILRPDGSPRPAYEMLSKAPKQ